MKKIILVLLLSILCGCSSRFLTDEELNKIIKDDNYIIIDVRTKEEYEEMHIKDAINVPYDEINKSLSIDKKKIILVYCRSGKRSNLAYQTLKDLDYQVYDLGAMNSVNLEKE